MFGFKKKEKEVILNNEQKVAYAKRKIELSLNLFKEINEDIEEANEVLQVVIAEDTQRMMDIAQNIENAKDELTANKALQEKLNTFIK
jgi:DNA polymerase/3'-5' exonuclease PolX